VVDLHAGVCTTCSTTPQGQGFRVQGGSGDYGGAKP
jgi:hypothetical protein